MQKWLMAALLRVWVPSLKFDIIPYWWGKQGLTKTYSLATLFGSENVLEENIFVFYKNENVFVRELQNSIAEQYKLSFLEPTIKDAISRLAVHNQFHSMKDEIRKLRDYWRKVGKDQWAKLYPGGGLHLIYLLDKVINVNLYRPAINAEQKQVNAMSSSNMTSGSASKCASISKP
jgi:predicted P-loop ATPase